MKKKLVLYDLVSLLFFIPVLIDSMMKSIRLIHIPFDSSFFESYFLQQNGAIIIYFVLLLNIMLVLSIVILFLVNIGLIYKNDVSIVKSWVGNIIILSSLFNVLVVWFLSQLQNIESDIVFMMTFWLLGVFVKFVLLIWQHLKRR